ncbi:Endonuclease/exonuclease/phosphatase, partial [Mycena belliarum]
MGPPEQPPRAPTPLIEDRVFPGPPITDTGQRKKKTKAATMLAALNMKGLGNPNPWHPKHKWYHVNQVMKDDKIGVLVVGEAHLSAARHANIQSLFGRRLEIVFSEDPVTANAKGLAFVVNKDLMKTENIKTQEIIPGRAMLLTLDGHGNQKICILGVYAPNPSAENAQFWKSLREFFENNENNPDIPKPDFMGGDTNIVEDAIDRLPSHSDPENAVMELDKLKEYLGLVDGWRRTYPNTRAYTYIQSRRSGNGSQSRIDRIYVHRDLFRQTYEWRIKTVGISTDHRMVSVRVTTAGAPTTGPGRWVWPAYIMKDKELTSFIHERGMQLQEDLKHLADLPQRNPNNNAQTLWLKFKNEIGDKARARSKILIPKAAKEIANLEAQLDTIINDLTLSEDERILSATILTERLAATQIKKHNTSRLSAQVRNRLEGEVIGRYWSALNRAKKPREAIQRLFKPGHDPLAEIEAQYETDSRRMATIARNYHNSIQKQRRDTPPDIRDPTIEVVLQRVVRKTTPAQADDLKRQLTRADVELSLKLSANNKAPGLNGIPYEVWRILDSRFQTKMYQQKPAFDIVGALQIVFNDIETYGVVPTTGFAKSWMAPLYKKNDPADIVNYRPISLLNTDYKVFTKALTIKL